MSRLVFDIEANALRPEDVTKVHCIAVTDLDSDREWTFRPDQIEDGLALLKPAKQLVAHNGIDYDLPVLRYLYSFTPDGYVVDTLVASRLLHPDRPRPLGLTGRTGPHSVEAWGIRFGIPKVQHENWTEFSEDMMNRCLVDARIQKRIYQALYKEAMQ